MSFEQLNSQEGQENIKIQILLSGVWCDSGGGVTAVSQHDHIALLKTSSKIVRPRHKKRATRINSSELLTSTCSAP